MAKFFSNKEIAKLLRSIAAAYVVRGGDFFKIVAYNRAADSVEHATSELKDLWDDGKLDTIASLGKGIQGYLDELFKTGKVKHFHEVKKGLPEAMFEIMDVPGLGPKTAYKLTKELKIENIEDLESKAKAGRISKLEGFGKKSEQDILAAISEFKNRSSRHLLPLAFSTAQRVLTYLRQLKECQRAEPLGSLRRMVATVGDIDIAVASENAAKVIDHFKKFKEINRILEAGPRTSSVILKGGMQVDLMVQPPEAFGALLQHFTGSKNHNIHLRELALKKGYSLSEYGIKVKGKLRQFRKEEEFYKFLGLEWIPPELREDAGEIEAALRSASGKPYGLPKIVDITDIKGDIHLHSNYPIEPSHDLGVESFDEIINKAVKLGYKYVGLSDHSPGHSTHTKKQIIDLIAKRSKRIEQLKSSIQNIRILNLLEIDILANGELSVPEEGLQLLDGSIAGIHSSHRQDKKTITKRMLVACQSPYVRVISHPTGRLLMERESYEVDWPLIFKECAKTDTILEINAWPNRLDLPDVLAREAIRAGVKLVINSDSHAVEQMENIKFGVAVARRGWATKSDIINTLPWVEFRKIFKV
ncbi:DNA polymerase/3'-5' exonuclease PolX [Candidatus Curtissbacteria bacterium]|nr:DNA polymerase/3'-5' exonuclease PolX [Candidatus Curtissbacteria bacterium]